MKKNSNFYLLSILFVGFAILIFTSCDKNDSSIKSIDLSNRTYKGITETQPYWYKINDVKIYTNILHYTYFSFATSKDLMLGTSSQREDNPLESMISYSTDYTYSTINDSITIYNSNLSVKFTGKYKNTFIIVEDTKYPDTKITFLLQK